MHDAAFRLTEKKPQRRWWRLVYDELGGLWGLCEHDKRLLHVDRHLSDEAKFHALCHEFLHARFPYLVEEEIENAGTELAEMLLAQGWVHKPGRKHGRS